MPVKADTELWDGSRWAAGRRAVAGELRRLRLYETAQLMAPALAGLALGHGSAPPARPARAAMLGALFTHLLFTYNDYIDFDLDRRNPRKSGR